MQTGRQCLSSELTLCVPWTDYLLIYLFTLPMSSFSSKFIPQGALEQTTIHQLCYMWPGIRRKDRRAVSAAMNPYNPQPPSVHVTPKNRVKPVLSASRETAKYRLSDRIDLPLKVNNRAFFKTSALLQNGVLRRSLLWVRLAVQVQVRVNGWLQNQNYFRNKYLLVLL